MNSHKMDVFSFVMIAIFFSTVSINSTEPMPIPNTPEMNDPEFLPPIKESKTSPEMLPISPNTIDDEPHSEKTANEPIDVEPQQNEYENYLIAGVIVVIIITILYRQNIIKNKFSRMGKYKLK